MCCDSSVGEAPTPLSPFELSGSVFANQDELFFELARRSNWRQWQVRMLHCCFAALVQQHCPRASGMLPTSAAASGSVHDIAPLTKVRLF